MIFALEVDSSPVSQSFTVMHVSRYASDQPVVKNIGYAVGSQFLPLPGPVMEVLKDGSLSSACYDRLR